LGIDPTLVEVRLGDSVLPQAPVSGGSQSSASVLPAIQDATTQLKLKLTDLALTDVRSPLMGLKASDIDAKDGKLINKNNPSQSDSLFDLIARNGNKPVEAMGSAESSESKDLMTANSWGAVFAEVVVDQHTHMVKVRRVVATYDIGTLLNHKTGLNQLMGGIVWGVSFALYEQAHIDPMYGRVVNGSLAEYHVPVNADIGVIDATVLNIPDLRFNPIGSRGIGEIGITGSAAAVANAIYNATGKRTRE
jgi:xanthine dehydrogenase YagR molybdenum-binding subunit